MKNKWDDDKADATYKCLLIKICSETCTAN